MKPFRKFLLLALLTIFTGDLNARDNSCSVTKIYPVRKGTVLRLANKYGDINILTVSEDSLSICATITIAQDDDKLIQKNLKLINISINKINDTIDISTLYDKKFFSEESRQGRKSFSVDYFIKLPVYMDLRLKNEFGNISLDEISGTLNIRHSQGMLSAKRLSRGNIKPISTIYVDHGKVDLDETNWMTLTLFNCPSVNIGKAHALMITSSISKIKTGVISSLVSNSKSDSYTIESINNLVSESTYSSYEIGRLTGQLKSEAMYGSIILEDIPAGFTAIDITSEQTRLELTPGLNPSFSADIIANDTTVEFPEDKYPGLVKAVAGFSTIISGVTGSDKKTRSAIRIRATAGKLIIQ